jgi:tetratricopeptide (TPR) repeat protein
VAAQLQAAGDLEASAKMFEHVAHDLMARSEARAAASLFKRAVSIWQLAHDNDATIQAGIGQAEALVQAGDGKGASDVLTRLERFGTVSAAGLRARIVSVIARSKGDLELAARTLIRASEIAIDSLDSIAWYQVEADLAQLLQEMSRPEEAEVHAALALELSISMLDSDSGQSGIVESTRVSQAASLLSRLRATLKRYDDAQTVLQSALERAASRGDEASASRVLANLAFIASCQNDVTKAVELAARALGFARKTGDRMAAARIAINIGSYHARLGHEPQAIDNFMLAKTLSRSIGWKRGLELAREALRKLGHSSQSSPPQVPVP